jgi:hypothetical protein
VAATGYADVVSVRPWELAEQNAGLSNPAALANYSGNNPNNPITLASGIYQNLAFVCSELILPNNNTKLLNCSITCTNSSFGVRLDANTGEETGRYLEHCAITAAGVALSGAGFTARLCEVVNNGDDSCRLGRSHAEPTVLELCHFHGFRPQAGAHADGVQIVTPPAADVVIWGCSISMDTAVGYSLPAGAGYTGALFVDTSDVPIAGGDPEPTRLGGIWVEDCKLVSSNNYSVVVDGPNTDIRNCTLLPGTTAIESIQAGVAVTGGNNTDAAGSPIVDTDIHGDPRTRFLTVGDPRQTGGGGTLAALSDVALSSPSGGQVLTYNGTAWANATPAGGGGQSMSITSGKITTGNVPAVNTAGSWLPVAGTSKSTSAVVGDQVRAEYGFLTNAGSGTYYDIGVVVGGSIVRLLNAPAFPPDSGYEGMPETNPDNTNQFFGPAVNGWFNALSGDLSGGNVTFCIAQKSTGAGALEMNIDIPVTYNLYNNHH